VTSVFPEFFLKLILDLFNKQHTNNSRTGTYRRQLAAKLKDPANVNKRIFKT